MKTLTEPHIDGTIKSFVLAQYCINLGVSGSAFLTANTSECCQRSHMGESKSYDIDASETRIRGRSRSSFSRELSSFNRRSFRSAMDCFLFLTSPPARISYAAAGISSIALDESDR